MINKILIAILFLVATTASAQEVSVEKSEFGIQGGLFGIWINNESRLANDFALRSEIGLDAGMFMTSFYEGVGFLATPVITAEPRWYYNLRKRAARNKTISGNNGNFLSVKTSYNPNWFLISNHDNIQVLDQLTIIPTWGFRRNIGSHFNFETQLGFGYRYVFADKEAGRQSTSEGALNLSVRLGYRF